MKTQDFIDQFGYGLECMAAMSLPHARLFYDRLCAGFAVQPPAAMRVFDDRIGAVAVRRFVPADADEHCVVYAHGGGFEIGSVRSHHGVTASLASLLSREVVSIDYRLAPQASYADMLADCKQVIRSAKPLALVGDSAGATLIMDTAHTLDCRLPLGLVYPLAGKLDASSLGADAPLLSRQDVLVAQTHLTHATADPDRFADQPPAPAIELLTVARDPLTQPLQTAAQNWRNAGASVGYRCAQNMVHGALHGHALLPSMAHAWREFCRSLNTRIR